MGNHADVAQYLLNRLRGWGAYLYHEATTGSIYIKFPHWALGSIRIGDHRGIKKYRYRWRVRSDKPKNWEHLFKEENIWIFEVGIENIEALIRKFEDTAHHRGVRPGDVAEYQPQKSAARS